MYVSFYFCKGKKYNECAECTGVYLVVPYKLFSLSLTTPAQLLSRYKCCEKTSRKIRQKLILEFFHILRADYLKFKFPTLSRPHPQPLSEGGCGERWLLAMAINAASKGGGRG
jgi:hypothetical protein